MKQNFDTLKQITYGLYIIAAANRDKRSGFISNTVFQVTADPPQIAIGTHKDNFTTQLIERSQQFSISILQEKTDLNFLGPFGFKSGENIDKFENKDYFITDQGVPVMREKCLAYFVCKVKQKIDTGTHLLFIGEVKEMDTIKENGTPLSYNYYHNEIKGKTPKNSPTYTENNKQKNEKDMEKYKCSVCGFIYEPKEGHQESGVTPGTKFEQIPENWTCPVCGAGKEAFNAEK